MGLPKIDLPIFEAEIISSGDKVRYRPFTVKEEKILLMAQETNEGDQILLAMKQLVNNCCVSDINVDELPLFDLEYLLLQIRGKSVNNIISFTITDPDTNNPVQCEINIEDISLTIPDNHSKEIIINEESILLMKYPKLDQMKMFLSTIDPDVNPVDILFNVMIGCIDCVVVGDEVQTLSDFSESEVREFIDSLPGSAVEDLKKFFETMPSLSYTLKYTNSDGNDKEMLLEGTESFFL